MRKILLAALLAMSVPTPAQQGRTTDHDSCYDYDCGGSDGNTGYDGEGGRSGDMDQGGDDNCRNFCDNIIYIPSPGGGEERPR
jgi:hypothetical protein